MPVSLGRNIHIDVLATAAEEPAVAIHAVLVTLCTATTHLDPIAAFRADLGRLAGRKETGEIAIVGHSWCW